MRESDNPLLMLFWRRERRWFWLRSNIAVVVVLLVGLLALLEWGLFTGESIFFTTSVYVAIFVCAPLTTLVAMGRITQEVKNLRQKGRMADLLITPMTNRDYLRGFLFPTMFLIGGLYTGVALLLLVHFGFYRSLFVRESMEIPGEKIALLALSLIYAWIQLFYSSVITLRCVIAFRSAMVGEAIATLVLVGIPFVIMVLVGLGVTGGDFVGYIFLEGLLCCAKLVATATVLRHMLDNFCSLVRVPEFDSHDAG